MSPPNSRAGSVLMIRSSESQVVIVLVKAQKCRDRGARSISTCLFGLELEAELEQYNLPSSCASPATHFQLSSAIRPYRVCSKQCLLPFSIARTRR